MLIIGIAGGSGSGKTTVVNKITDKIGNNQLAIISQDSYYYDSSHIPMEDRKRINFDHPNSIEFSLLIEHIRRLKQGQSIEQPIYSHITCTRSERTMHVDPKDVIIVEGILVLSNPELRDLMDIKVFVETDADERLMRRIQRDMIERGRSIDSILTQYRETVKPMHEQFVEPSKKYADIIIPRGGENLTGINILTEHLKLMMAE